VIWRIAAKGVIVNSVNSGVTGPNVNKIETEMKLFQTGNIEVVKCCQLYFGFELPSLVHNRRAT